MNKYENLQPIENIEHLIDTSAAQKVTASVVQTPINEYIVLNYDPFFGGPGKEMLFMRRMKVCAPLNYIKDDHEVTYNKMLEAIMQKPDTLIGEDVSNLPYNRKIPAGTIAELLSDSMIAKDTDIFISKLKKRHLDLQKDKQIVIDKWEDPDMDEAFNDTKYVFVNTIYEQLIRKSAENHLEFFNEAPPSFVEKMNDWLFVIDGGHGSNCGYGSSNAFVHKIQSEMHSQHKGFFPSYDLELEKYPMVHFGFLSGIATAHLLSGSDEINRSKDIMYFDYRGDLAYFCKINEKKREKKKK